MSNIYTSSCILIIVLSWYLPIAEADSLDRSYWVTKDIPDLTHCNSLGECSMYILYTIEVSTYSYNNMMGK